jgi:hypothetical protein
MKSLLLFLAGFSPETASRQWIFAKHIVNLQMSDSCIYHTATRQGNNINFVCRVKRIIQLRLNTVCEVKLVLHGKRLMVVMPSFRAARILEVAWGGLLYEYEPGLPTVIATLIESGIDGSA